MTSIASESAPLSSGRLAATGLYLLAWPVLILVLAGDGQWLEGWLFGGWFFGFSATVIAWLYRHDPALLAERYRRVGSGGQKGWDRVWVIGLGVSFVAWMVLMPLDARRFGWSPRFPAWLEAFGGVCLLASSFFLFRAFQDNTFLSPLVRIQRERQQHVVSTGVYAFVRHPMYLGAIFLFVGAPLLMGSLVGLAVSALMTLLVALRIVGEERMLNAELEGYAQYREKVRYRLIPYVW